jgi:hypothetical protein
LGWRRSSWSLRLRRSADKAHTVELHKWLWWFPHLCLFSPFFIHIVPTAVFAGWDREWRRSQKSYVAVDFDTVLPGAVGWRVNAGRVKRVSVWNDEINSPPFFLIIIFLLVLWFNNIHISV